jgi:hypothetical protein
MLSALSHVTVLGLWGSISCSCSLPVSVDSAPVVISLPTLDRPGPISQGWPPCPRLRKRLLPGLVLADARVWRLLLLHELAIGCHSRPISRLLHSVA